MNTKQGNILLWSAIAVGAPRWAGAMLAADVGSISPGLSQLLHVLNTISGLAMGPLEVLAMAFMLDSLRKQKPTYRDKVNFRWWGVLGFSVGLLALTPAILAPYIVSRINSTGISGVVTTTGWQFAWSIAVTLAPVFIVGGVAFAQAGIIHVASDAISATQITQDRPVANYPRLCPVAGCEYVASDRFAFAAHMRVHRTGSRPGGIRAPGHENVIPGKVGQG